VKEATFNFYQKNHTTATYQTFSNLLTPSSQKSVM